MTAYFEVQRRVAAGDTAGQWHTVPGLPSNMGQTAAEDRGVTLKAAEPGERFRVVPFGTGPEDDSDGCPPHCCCGSAICCDCGEVAPPPSDTTAGGGC